MNGRKIYFYENDKIVEGKFHQWFLCSGITQVPYALIEKKDGTMAFVNYHDVQFDPIDAITIEDLMEFGIGEADDES